MRVLLLFFVSVKRPTLLNGYYPLPRGWPLNRGSTVFYLTSQLLRNERLQFCKSLNKKLFASHVSETLDLALFGFHEEPTTMRHLCFGNWTGH